MLDTAIQDQLRSVFEKLEDEVILRVQPSSHADQAELLAMLNDVAQTSPRIRVEQVPSGAPLSAPRFEIVSSAGAVSEADSARGAIAFRGVPGGHEFSSLILAILHREGKGKLPDDGIVRRIQGLKGPVKLRTYVSLSCENCPEVVQALNLMATLHPDFEHETVDGGVAQDEITALGIQGVPAVIDVSSGAGKLVHSGKSQLIDLLDKLEQTLGKAPTQPRDPESLALGEYDVVVVGGGPAGASSAIYSARKGLKVAIVAERMGGQLQETKGIENMISVPYTEGVRLSAQLSEHLSQYPVRVLEHRRVASISSAGPASGPNGEAPRRIELESGEWLHARKIIIATGAKWRQLGIPGEKEHIGMGVAFCAHCDGPFYKGRRVAVVGGGNSGVEAAIDLANIAESVVLLEYGERLKADGVLVEKLNALPNARVLTRAKSTRVIGDGAKVSGLEYQDLGAGELKSVEVDGVFVQIGLLPNSRIVQDLVELTPHGEIVVDARGRTTAPGIYAAGDVTTVPFKQIVVAMGDGAKVALAAFEDRLKSAATA